MNRVLWLALTAALTLCARAIEGGRSLLKEKIVLGAEKLEWDHFKGRPVLKQFEAAFQLPNTGEEQALLIRQMDVKADGWTIFINEKNVGRLQLLEEPGWVLIPLSAELLKGGENKIRIANPSLNGTASFADQIEVGPIKLYAGAATNLFSSSLQIAVKEEHSPQMPARITITDEEGALVAWQNLSGSTVAARTGVAYTGDGQVRMGLMPGAYNVFATRGSEYSLARTTLSIKPAEKISLNLELAREVPTPGFVAADTHIHTFTHSRHGDSTVEERVLTIAGEGIELPIVTEHNMHRTYAEEASRLGVSKYFTLVQGNEVTTAQGHFNIFPVELSAKPPEWKTNDWGVLLRNIRETPHVQVVILNHPTDPHSGFIPFAQTNLLRGVGRSLSDRPYEMDAVEVVNSGAMRSDWREPFQGWFDLLNYGHKVVAVSGSDSHDVSRFGVGQGRTYVEMNDTDVSHLNLGDACAAIKNGKAFVSLGLFPTIRVNEKYSLGDLVPSEGKLHVQVKVLGPKWIEASKVELFANGEKVAEQNASGSTLGKVEKISANWEIPRFYNDVWLVAIASGPGVREPYWTIPRPYQPTTTNPNSPALAATNPIWVDNDGDGKFTPARTFAAKVLNATPAEKILTELDKCDPSVLRQAADLVAQGKSGIPKAEFEKRLQNAPRRVREFF